MMMLELNYTFMNDMIHHDSILGSKKHQKQTQSVNSSIFILKVETILLGTKLSHLLDHSQNSLSAAALWFSWSMPSELVFAEDSNWHLPHLSLRLPLEEEWLLRWWLQLRFGTVEKNTRKARSTKVFNKWQGFAAPENQVFGPMSSSWTLSLRAW